MQQIWLRKTGKPEVLQLEESADISSIQDHEVLIDVHFSGLNFADIVMRIGMYPDAPKKPFVPGYEVSGIVKAIGRNVKSLKVGDEVAAGTLFGGYTSLLIAQEDLTFKIPSSLSLAEAATLPVNWMTAHAAIMDMARVRNGDQVLVDSATGGVGTIALQMLKALGANTIGLTSSIHKKSYIEALGAKAYTHQEFEQQKLQSGFDLILNSEGGASVKKHYNLLNATGRVVAYGMSMAINDGKLDLFGAIKMFITTPRFYLLSMFDKNRGVYALNVLKLLESSMYRKSIKEKWQWVEKLQLKPHVDKIFPAKDVALAHRMLETKQAKGKVLLSWK